MKEKDILKTILDRLARLDGMTNIFTADEFAQWPDGALESLQNQDLLKKTEIAKELECLGCEQNCIMPVQVATNETRGLTKAFIACDKRDDVGRVPVELARLTQWRFTGHTLALKLAEMLGFEQDPKEKQKAKSWELGVLKGKINRPHLVLSIENGACLKVGSQEVALLDVLAFKNGKLSLDVEELYRMADQPPKNVQKYKPTAIKREAKKLATNNIYAMWQKKYRELKKSRPRMSAVWYSQQIAKSDVSQDRDSETIRKHMKK